MDLARIKEKLKHHFQEVIRTKTSPHSIALGFAIGSFIGLLPTPGLNIILGIIVLLLFEKINKISLFAGILIWNPLTSIPIYLLSYKIGDFLFGKSVVVMYELNIFQHIYFFARRFLIGNFILAASIALISYFLVKLFFTAYYKNQSAQNDAKK
jgi:uncharacterized protein